MKQGDPDRSRIMRAVKGKDTSPERFVRSILHRAGYRFRLHATDLPGKPDIIFRRRKKAIFVHGCFWHGHNCKRGARIPKSNTQYWKKKIGSNIDRDVRSLGALKALGWSVAIVWECELKEPNSVMRRMSMFLDGELCLPTQSLSNQAKADCEDILPPSR
ncbi:very short patch repair endonuclease [Aurantiacibacter zhengii]|uniref:DNA mismatch endonuclease Vsr n=1 Tax=Aurantiacibacter zhengii TaxID=2307003 RepID=A0A418NTX1_9SPHN|nr:very short patch repair endonuclease [Aurantiacibacter zhengii]RIV86851.1 DNA mismatch endonuclease Vsr [Aurantiacibacter zhengii]